jgi:hypothetical protein
VGRGVPAAASRCCGAATYSSVPHSALLSTATGSPAAADSTLATLRALITSRKRRSGREEAPELEQAVVGDASASSAAAVIQQCWHCGLLLEAVMAYRVLAGRRSPNALPLATYSMLVDACLQLHDVNTARVVVNDFRVATAKVRHAEEVQSLLQGMQESMGLHCLRYGPKADGVALLEGCMRDPLLQRRPFSPSTQLLLQQLVADGDLLETDSALLYTSVDCGVALSKKIGFMQRNGDWAGIVKVRSTPGSIRRCRLLTAHCSVCAS